MIKNQKQYTQLSKELKELTQNIQDLEIVIRDAREVAPELQLQLSDFRRLLLKGEKELVEYKRLVSEELNELEFDSLKDDDMNKAIMSFRIASKLTQKQIAEMMYIQEQQIQRYEQQDYLSASFERVLQLLEALDVQMILRKRIIKSERESGLSGFLFPQDEELIERVLLETKKRHGLVRYSGL